MSDNVEIPSTVLTEAIETLKKQNTEATEEKKDQLLEENEVVRVDVLMQIADKKRNTPLVIQLPHPIFSVEEGDNAIFFIADNDQQTKSRLEEVPVRGVEKVVNIGKARLRLGTYKLKRELMHNYRVYLADESVTPLMPAIIGKKAMEAKRYPIPVRTKTKDAQGLAENIKKALSSTQLFLFGNHTSIRAARINSSTEEILSNVCAVLDGVNTYIPFLSINRISLTLPGRRVVIYQADGDIVSKVAMMTPKEKKAYVEKRKNVKREQIISNSLKEQKQRKMEEERKAQEKKEEEKAN